MAISRRRSYIARQDTHCDQMHACIWCDRTMVDVLLYQPGTAGAPARYECVNRRACMKERFIRVQAACLVRQQERAAEAAADAAQTPGQLALF